MRKEYIEQLKNFEISLKEAEKFTKKLPIFEKQIIENKYTGNEDHINFGDRYKDIYLSWGIGRGLYKSGSSRYITNYKGSYTKFLFHIYINTYSLFGHHHSFRLDEMAEKTDLFFYDKLNSTFYATDKQITNLLEELNNWYLIAVEENKKLLANKKIEDAEKEIKKQKEIIKDLIK